MIGQYLSSKKFGPKYLAALCASTAILTAGCANMTTTASDANSFGSAAATISGNVHGGNQPVGFATVNLYSVGQSGVGSAGTLLATTTTTASGSFSFNQQATPSSSSAIQPTALGGNSYECGNQADPLLYIMSRGGNTVGTGGSGVNNSAAVFLAPVGFCSTSASARVNVTEVTTAATVAAVGQFINPSTETIGNDGIAVAYVAIANAFGTVANLVDPSTGLALTGKILNGKANSAGTSMNTASSLNVSGVFTVATPEYAKLNTVGNILSACINQTSANSSTACSSLFAAAVPPPAAHTSQPNATFSTASDTLQAALYMFINPTDTTTSNRTTLFNLSPAAGAPYQPTLTSVPTDWTVGILYTSNNNCDSASGSSKFLSSPYGLAIDGSGNVWVSNSQSSSSALVGLTATGTPLSCVTLGGTLASGGTTSTVVDDTGNVWYGDSSNNSIYRFRPTTGAVLSYNTAVAPHSITADGADNVFFSGVNGSTGSVYKIQSGATASSTGSPLLISNIAGSAPNSLFPDSNTNLWVTSGSNFVTQLSTATGGANYIQGYNSTQFPVTGPSTGVTVASVASNTVYVSSGTSSTVTALATSGASYATKTGFPTAANTGGVNSATGIYIDGASSSWVGSSAPSNSSNYNYGVSVIATDGSAISTSGVTAGGYEKAGGYFNSLRNVMIDQGGNVWVTNNSSNSITEVVGAAVPIYQPYSFGITQNRFQQIP